MRIQYALLVPVLLLFLNDSYAESASAFKIDQAKIMHHQFDDNYGDIYILNDSSIFVAKSGANDPVILTTLFYSGPDDKKRLINTMLWTLEVTNASKKFIEWAKKNLAKNRRFEKDSFVMPLKSFDMTTHEFTYSNTGHNQLYILSYRRLQPEM